MIYKVTCPYCGARAVCVPASSIFGGTIRRKGDYIYRCSRWPVCDAYVSAHRKDHRPMGTLANAGLRRKRMQAHEALDAMCRSRHTDKWAAYLWLQCKLRLEPEQTHIGMFSEAQCNRVIALCREASARSDHSTPMERSTNEKEYRIDRSPAATGRIQSRSRHLGHPGRHSPQRKHPRPRL